MREMLPAQQQKKTGAQGEAHARRAEIPIAAPRIVPPTRGTNQPRSLKPFNTKAFAFSC